jgi:hypothetical protein
MPSDLAGLTTALYDWDRTDKNYKAAVGPACDSIREVIRNLGFSETKVNTQIRAVQDGLRGLVKLAQGELNVAAVAAPLTSGTPGRDLSLTRRMTIKPLK